MKSYSLIFILATAMLCSCIISCTKDSQTPATKYPSPNWTTDTSATFAYSMTAVIQLPDTLHEEIKDGDKLAAFVDDDCRGVGVIIKRDGQPDVFYILIKGSASEESKIKFKYYNAGNSYMYATDDFLNFEVDNNYGTVDDPAKPDFQVVN
jgi:hypothetical protein